MLDIENLPLCFSNFKTILVNMEDSELKNLIIEYNNLYFLKKQLLNDFELKKKMRKNLFFELKQNVIFYLLIDLFSKFDYIIIYYFIFI